MTFWQRKEQAARLRAIPLEAVLPLCGGKPDPHDKHKWHTQSAALSVSGSKFINWNMSADKKNEAKGSCFLHRC